MAGKRYYNTTVSPPLRRFHRDDRNDKAGVWLMSDWNPQCSLDCNANSEHRTIYCDRTAPYTDLCDARIQPDQKRLCKPQRSTTCRKGNWFTSEWSNCTGECFKLQRTRMVLCIQDGYVVDAQQCDMKTRPLDVANCTQRDVDFCGPKWHYSEWSEVSCSLKFPHLKKICQKRLTVVISLIEVYLSYSQCLNHLKLILFLKFLEDFSFDLEPRTLTIAFFLLVQVY